MGERGPAILDVTCGGRQMWFDKSRTDTIYLDIRQEPRGRIPAQPNWSVEPDVLADFTALPFPDDAFDVVVFDPPHAAIMSESIIGLKYGTLFGDWRPVLAAGLRECFRVVARGGSLVFKWAESHAAIGDVLGLVPEMVPAFGHVTAKSGPTMWVLFYKGRSADG